MTCLLPRLRSGAGTEDSERRKGISFVELNKKDIVRHKLVTQIVEAYEKFDKEAKAERERRKAEQADSKIEQKQ